MLYEQASRNFRYGHNESQPFAMMISETTRILIAEDHYVSRHLLERNLNNWGFSVVTAEDGEQAAEILDSDHAPSLAILDWMMPKMDGVEVCTRVRKRVDRPYIYLVLLTAKSQKEEIAAGLEAGADDYVVKPFDPDELRARLKVGQRVVELERTLARKVDDLQLALADVKRLRRLLPICMYCKSIGMTAITGTSWRLIFIPRPAPTFRMASARSA
jgi:CheY-like chemotaxis protein